MYRGPVTDNEGSQEATLASYSPFTYALNGGNSTAHVLYDSQNFMKTVMGNSNVANTAARAAGRRPKTFRMKGQMT